MVINFIVKRYVHQNTCPQNELCSILLKQKRMDKKYTDNPIIGDIMQLKSPFK